jgi:hypothetical protein
VEELWQVKAPFRFGRLMRLCDRFDFEWTDVLFDVSRPRDVESECRSQFRRGTDLVKKPPADFGRQEGRIAVLLVL